MDDVTKRKFKIAASTVIFKVIQSVVATCVLQHLILNNYLLCCQIQKREHAQNGKLESVTIKL